jgi:hypothetical protein
MVELSDVLWRIREHVEHDILGGAGVGATAEWDEAC